jgi:stearoyl-CoA desaturase (delta-9 desaturase)
MGWLFEDQHSSARRFAPDLRKDPVIRTIDKLFPLWVLLGLVLPFLAGLALSGGSLAAGLTAFLWAGLVRVFLLHHATWSVNSICHMYGRRPFAIDDQSRDNWLVALVSLGEGWHHSHHAFPTSAQHGLRRTQFDPSYLIIRGLERLGLVWNVKRPRDEQIAAKLRVPAGAGLDEPERQAA